MYLQSQLSRAGLHYIWVPLQQACKLRTCNDCCTGAKRLAGCGSTLTAGAARSAQIYRAGAISKGEYLLQAVHQVGCAGVGHRLAPVCEPSRVELAAEGGRLPRSIERPLLCKGSCCICAWPKVHHPAQCTCCCPLKSSSGTMNSSHVA